ncbi:mandelate racemase/muconate lactonizing enzyme family protein [Paraburkholderia sediminicola]|uniref:mandelate racemase/muconate lactonizing enzyme family protein n=1 Tax=Paraburkholderia sediminicola TaxID=458836 RepID=UPI0038BC8B9C
MTTIVQIEVMRVAIGFDAGRRVIEDTNPPAGDAFNAASKQLERMESLLVKVALSDGRVGWGEGFGHACNAATFAMLAGAAGRFFIGMPFDAAAQPEVLNAAAQRAFHSYGSTGPMMYALSAIDIALWDLAGQAAGVPLYRMLGASRARVDVYASLVSYDNDPAEVARQVHRVQAEGFTRIKLHETSADAIRAAREALPAEVELMVDVNCPWSAEEAATQAARLHSQGLAWLEEPVWPPDDYAGLARVRRSGVPIAAGENAAGIAGIRQYLESGAVDVLQPSVTKLGGVTAVREAIALANRHGVRVVPHCFFYGPGLLATAHLVASLPDTVALEMPAVRFDALLHPAMALRPTLMLPDTPGLGFAPDEEVLRRHLIDHAVVR